MGRPNWQVAWRKRSPAGAPLIGRTRVAQVLPAVPPPQVDYSEFSSDRYGGFGATVTVVSFPGDAADIADVFVSGERPGARKRKGPGIRVEAPTTEQTVSNRRRAELAGLAGVPEGKLDIFEGTV